MCYIYNTLKEKKFQKTISLYESQLKFLNEQKDESFDGDFSRVVRAFLKIGIDEYHKGAK